jgi:DNA-binding transcriptional regulator YdaS (Cro superfamily)
MSKLCFMSVKLTTKQMIGLCGGVTKVAKRFGVSTQAVHRWVHDDIPADKLIMLASDIEKQSHGLVSRKDLFPTTWHWIWPELQ